MTTLMMPPLHAPQLSEMSTYEAIVQRFGEYKTDFLPAKREIEATQQAASRELARLKAEFERKRNAAISAFTPAMMASVERYEGTRARAANACPHQMGPRLMHPRSHASPLPCIPAPMRQVRGDLPARVPALLR